MNNNRFYIIVIALLLGAISCNKPYNYPEQEVQFMLSYYIQSLDVMDTLYYDNMEDCLEDKDLLDSQEILNYIEEITLD